LPDQIEPFGHQEVFVLRDVTQEHHLLPIRVARAAGLHPACAVRALVGLADLGKHGVAEQRLAAGLLDRAVKADVQHTVTNGHARRSGGDASPVRRERGHARGARVVSEHELAAHALAPGAGVVVGVHIEDEAGVVEGVGLGEADGP